MMIGTVTNIFLKPTKREPMVSVPDAEIVPHHGLAGSRAMSSKTRKITLLSLEAWREVERQLGESIPIETRRANIVVEGLGDDLRIYIGQCLQIMLPHGAAIFIVGETDPCDRMDEAVPGLQQALLPYGRGGVHGLPIRPGQIAVGDRVLIVNPNLYPDIVERQRPDGIHELIWQPT